MKERDPGKREVSAKLFEEYLEVLAAMSADAEGGDASKAEKLLASFAELRYRLEGGSHCAICNAHVRHVVPVQAEYPDGVREYGCLCTRCMEAEKFTAVAVTLGNGNTQVRFEKGANGTLTAVRKSIPAKAGRPGT